MNKPDIIQQLKEGVIEVKFTKADGSQRVMSATLNDQYVTYDDSASSTKGKKADTAQPVWDINASGWRSFRWDSLQEVAGVKVS
jgi:phage-related protein